MSEPTLTKEFKSFKDGVYDAVIHGNRNWNDIRYPDSYEYYYKTGYDFGMTIWNDLREQETSNG